MATDDTYSSVYIADSAGTNKVYMDIDPNDPRVSHDYSRGEHRISWGCSYLTETARASIWTKYLAFSDVKVYDGTTEYLCRWADGAAFKWEKSAKPSLSAKFEFVVIQPASTKVYIANSGGGSKIYMDMEPFPFPEIRRDRNRKYLSWECKYITRANANSLISKFPSDVEVSLDNGSTKYLCKWEDSTSGLEIIPTVEGNLSCRVSFEILQTVGASPAGQIKIYDYNGSNTVTLDSDPWPFPQIKKSRTVSSEKCCPSVSGGNLVSGETVHFDGGVHVSDGEIEFEIPYLSTSNKTALQTKYDTLADVRVSLDGGSTKYYCTWADGVSFEPTPTGSASYSCRFKFKVISLVS